MIDFFITTIILSDSPLQNNQFGMELLLTVDGPSSVRQGGQQSFSGPWGQVKHVINVPEPAVGLL
jgi:hypothetical protein